MNNFGIRHKVPGFKNLEISSHGNPLGKPCAERYSYWSSQLDEVSNIAINNTGFDSQSQAESPRPIWKNQRGKVQSNPQTMIDKLRYYEWSI
jgi:hypothetical protein